MLADAVQAVLEGGEESTTVLIDAIARLLDGLAPDRVLEVVVEASRFAVIADWCRTVGHEAIQTFSDDGRPLIWIRKAAGHPIPDGQKADDGGARQ